MTEGYVLITKGKTILDAMYSRSDSYPSYLGIKVIDAICENRITRFIDDYKKETPEYNAVGVGIKRSWYIKTKESKQNFFIDYVYEYNFSNNVLTVFQYGKKLFTIPHDKLSFYKALFEANKLWEELTYDYDTLACTKNYEKELKKFLEKSPTVEDIKEIKDSFNPAFTLSISKCRDVWADTYIKTLTNHRTHKSISFYICKDTKRGYSIYIQTPFLRKQLTLSEQTYYKSEKKILSVLITHIKMWESKWLCTIHLFNEVDKFLTEINSLRKEKEYESVIKKCNELIQYVTDYIDHNPELKQYIWFIKEIKSIINIVTSQQMMGKK